MSTCTPKSTRSTALGCFSSSRCKYPLVTTCLGSAIFPLLATSVASSSSSESISSSRAENLARVGDALRCGASLDDRRADSGSLTFFFPSDLVVLRVDGSGATGSIFFGDLLDLGLLFGFSSATPSIASSSSCVFRCFLGDLRVGAGGVGLLAFSTLLCLLTGNSSGSGEAIVDS